MFPRLTVQRADQLSAMNSYRYRSGGTVWIQRPKARCRHFQSALVESTNIDAGGFVEFNWSMSVLLNYFSGSNCKQLTLEHSNPSSTPPTLFVPQFYM
jgi:hypothetical protein